MWIRLRTTFRTSDLGPRFGRHEGAKRFAMVSIGQDIQGLSASLWPKTKGDSRSEIHLGTLALLGEGA